MPIDNKKLASVAQLASIKEITDTEGVARGVRELICKNQKLSLNILQDRAFDIGELAYAGVNLSLLLKNGIVSPALSHTAAFDFAKSFPGGFLYTCGLDNIANATPSAVMHGRISATPGILIHKEITAANDGFELHIEGETRQSAIFGENILLRRKFTISENEIVIKDTIRNEGFREYPLYMLYHFNIGYPFLDDCISVNTNSHKIIPRNKLSESYLDKVNRADPVRNDYKELVYTHLFDAGTAVCEITNPCLRLKLRLEFPIDNLKYMVQWKNMLSGDYAMGIEPSTSFLDEKTPLIIPAGNNIENMLRLKILEI